MGQLIIMVRPIKVYFYKNIEFLMANIQIQDAFTKDRLKDAFNFFDVVIYICFKLNRIKMDIYLFKN